MHQMITGVLACEILGNKERQSGVSCLVEKKESAGACTSGSPRGEFKFYVDYF